MKSFFSSLYKLIGSTSVGKNMLKIIGRLRIDRFMYFIVDLFDPDFSAADVAEANTYFYAHRYEVSAVLHELCDDFSVETYKKMINYRMTGDRRYVLSVCRPVKDRYILRDRKGKNMLNMRNESIIDCGAYTGDDLENFIRQKITFKHYYAFEPDKDNIKEGHAFYTRPGVEVYEFAVGEKEGTLFFEKEGGVSPVGKLSETGSMTVEVRNLDTILKNKPVTMIKMDIEGAEMDALRGASRIIATQHPLLAISIYHSNEDMIRILPYIKSLVPEYQFYCRHYSYGYSDTILYAVCRDV